MRKTIKARRLKESEMPERAKLYEVRGFRDVTVEERQTDGSVDQVTLEYRMGENDVGYFAHEYLPEGMSKDGARRIDITAVVVNHEERFVKWYLYDIKAALAGEHTVVTLYNQWNAGVRYLRQYILKRVAGYPETPDLGVITRRYDEEKMKRLRDDCRRYCDEMERPSATMTLPQRKKRTDIAKYRARLKAAQAILDGTFLTEDGTDTYKIHIRLLCEDSRIYKMRFPI
ncbi:MAG: hypothetical protein NC337_01305 [Roseburia sp.]|nr:hypothetical protein [Roseburia sp.]